MREILQPGELEGLGEFLKGVAASNGVIDPGERRALKKAYRALGVAPERLAELLVALEGEADEPPVVQQRSSVMPSGQKLPPPPRDESRPAVTLNREALANIIADTAEVAVLIGKAMGEIELDTADEAESSAPTGVEPSEQGASEIGFDLDGLEPRYQPFVAKLVTQAQWQAGALDGHLYEHRHPAW